jgi:hypothetical protein
MDKSRLYLMIHVIAFSIFASTTFSATPEPKWVSLRIGYLTCNDQATNQMKIEMISAEEIGGSSIKLKEPNKVYELKVGDLLTFDVEKYDASKGLKLKMKIWVNHQECLRRGAIGSNDDGRCVSGWSWSQPNIPVSKYAQQDGIKRHTSDGTCYFEYKDSLFYWITGCYIDPKEDDLYRYYWVNFWKP